MAGGIISMFPGGGGGTTIVEAPDFTGVQNSFEYTGSPIGPESLVTYDTKHIKASGGTATDVGDHVMTFTLKNKKNMLWKDTMSTDDKTFKYTIGEVTVAAPTCNPSSATYTYNGSAHFPTVTRDEARTTMTVTNSSGTVIDSKSVINAGTYTITISLNSKTMMKWADNSGTEDRTFSFEINKAAGTLTLRDANNNDVATTGITLDKTTTSAVVTASNYVGTLSANSGDSTVVTVAVDGSNITLASPSGKTGTVNVTVSTTGDANHNGVTAQISVKGDFLFIGTFAATVSGNHLNDVAKALQAGSITVNDLPWSVGDEAQFPNKDGTSTTTWVIQNKESTNATGITFTDGTAIHYVIGMKNSESSTRAMNSTDTNNGSWNGSAMRTYCNGTFRNNLSTDIQNAFAKFKCVTAKTYNGSSNQTSEDYFALPAAKEVFGGAASSAGSGTSYSNLTEFNALKQFEWYKTSSNRIKKNGDSGSAGSWWERSPSNNGPYYFCSVDNSGNSGNANSHSADSARGCSPFGCI